MTIGDDGIATRDNTGASWKEKPDEQAQITPKALEGGFKADAGKARLDLLPVPALRKMMLDTIPKNWNPDAVSAATELINGLCNFWDTKASQPADQSIQYAVDSAVRLMVAAEGISRSDVILAVGELYALGAKKYADRNWEKGMDWGRCFAPAGRHLLKFFKGEKNDPVDGQHHLTSVIWCALALQHYNADLEQYGEFDTRKAIVVAQDKGQK